MKLLKFFDKIGKWQMKNKKLYIVILSILVLVVSVVDALFPRYSGGGIGFTTKKIYDMDIYFWIYNLIISPVFFFCLWGLILFLLLDNDKNDKYKSRVMCTMALFFISIAKMIDPVVNYFLYPENMSKFFYFITPLIIVFPFALIGRYFGKKVFSELIKENFYDLKNNAKV